MPRAVRAGRAVSGRRSRVNETRTAQLEAVVAALQRIAEQASASLA